MFRNGPDGMSSVDSELSETGGSQKIENFAEMAKSIIPSPGDIPVLKGIELFGGTIPLNGVAGGDHIIFLDFNQRFDLDARITKAKESGKEELAENLEKCRTRAGIVLADVSGHEALDALLALMLHQAFLLGAAYELDCYGDITTTLFEKLNTRFYRSSATSKYLTLLYGEISESGRFRFISAAHPIPVVFSSRLDRFVDISDHSVITFPPIGMIPSFEDIDRNAHHTVLGFKEGYEVNELTLMSTGDILILYTDGLSDHERESESYFPQRLEKLLRRTKTCTAREIFYAVKSDIESFVQPSDDISLVIIKRQ